MQGPSPRCGMRLALFALVLVLTQHPVVQPAAQAQRMVGYPMYRGMMRPMYPPYYMSPYYSNYYSDDYDMAGYSSSSYPSMKRDEYGTSSMRTYGSGTREERSADGEARSGSKNELAWPLGLRVLPPGPETTKLRQEIETLVEQAAKEVGASGRASETTLRQLKDDLARLRTLWRERADFLPVAQYTVEEATAFLTRLDAAVKTLEANSSPGSGYEK